MDVAEPVLVGGRSRARFDVVGLGENSLDRIYGVEGWPKSGSKQALEDWGVHPGGQVASAILGCARLGLRCAYAGTIGTDSAGGAVLAPLRRAGVDLRGVSIRPGARTRSALILVRRGDGERSVLIHRDPQLDLAPPLSCARSIEESRIVHLDATDPDASLWAARVARAAGVPIVLDLDQASQDVDGLLALAEFPVVSRSFAEEWGGADSAEAGLERIASGGCRLAVVTCDEVGAIAQWNGQLIRAPAFEVPVRDTIGAGDAFHAGFIWAVLQGQSVTAVLRSANAVAAVSCTALGAQQGLPTANGLSEFLESTTDS